MSPLTLNQLFMLWGGFAVCFCWCPRWSGVDTWQLATEEDETREQWRLLQETNDRLRASYSATADPALEARVAALRLEQLEREQLVSMLADYHNQQALGFSGYLCRSFEPRRCGHVAVGNRFCNAAVGGSGSRA